MSRYTSITDADRERMLAAIGVGSVAELFERQIPEPLRLSGALQLGEIDEAMAGMGEEAVYEHLRELAARNVSCEEQVSFLGAGMYDHYVPAIVDALCERSEFLTPYTPYQPEVSQGGLQVMFEYQTAISELTGLPVSNASVYEGPSAVASAAYMSKLHNGGKRIVASATLHPHTLQTLRTYAHGFGSELAIVGCGSGEHSGLTDRQAWAAAIDERTSAAIFAQPSFYGAVEDAEELARLAREARGEGGASAAGATAGASGGPVVIAQVDPITLGVLRSPGECDVDVAVGEGQPLGGRLDFGGPSFGFFAAKQEYLRRMPGRIAGETRDADGRRGFVLTLQTREQHIRREKATSNICTAQALNALAGMVHLAWLGRAGIVELGELLLARTHYARRQLTAIDGVTALSEAPSVRELTLALDAEVAEVRRHCIERAGVNPGVDLEALSGREEDRSRLLVAITERRGRADIDALVQALTHAMRERGRVPA
ncbi:MAG: aminomethyl-transferring glycine dehydrogenase subunit GcvPA [Solirubrobacteraceae bacterium]